MKKKEVAARLRAILLHPSCTVYVRDQLAELAKELDADSDRQGRKEPKAGGSREMHDMYARRK